jgi:PAS domain-containing protein
VEEWVGACTDIHERRLAEIQLRESEERARLALDIAQLGTMTWVPDDDDVLADARCREILRPAGRRRRLALADLEGRIHDEERADVLAGLGERGAALDRRTRTSFRFVHGDGSMRWVVSAATSVHPPGQHDRAGDRAADLG